VVSRRTAPAFGSQSRYAPSGHRARRLELQLVAQQQQFGRVDGRGGPACSRRQLGAGRGPDRAKHAAKGRGDPFQHRLGAAVEAPPARDRLGDAQIGGDLALGVQLGAAVEHASRGPDQSPASALAQDHGRAQVLDRAHSVDDPVVEAVVGLDSGHPRDLVADAVAVVGMGHRCQQLGGRNRALRVEAEDPERLARPVEATLVRAPVPSADAAESLGGLEHARIRRNLRH